MKKLITPIVGIDAFNPGINLKPNKNIRTSEIRIFIHNMPDNGSERLRIIQYKNINP